MTGRRIALALFLVAVAGYAWMLCDAFWWIR